MVLRSQPSYRVSLTDTETPGPVTTVVIDSVSVGLTSQPSTYVPYLRTPCRSLGPRFLTRVRLDVTVTPVLVPDRVSSSPRSQIPHPRTPRRLLRSESRTCTLLTGIEDVGHSRTPTGVGPIVLSSKKNHRHPTSL